MKRVLCNAIVDPLPDGLFYVTVTGQGGCDGVTRVYTIEGTDDNAAARECIQKFIKEMEDL